jgi:6-phosphogluconate dehydrogenase
MSPMNKQTRTTQHFIALLCKPRAIMMLVPNGAPVDSVIKDLLPHLDERDLIIDTERQIAAQVRQRFRS